MVLRVLSLGAGVQSTTLALMAAHGEIAPMPDCAITADTGNEGSKTYEHMAWLASPNVLPYPLYFVSSGDIIKNIRLGASGGRWASIPAFTRHGRVRQQCTTDFKKVAIKRKVRELAGLYRKRSPKTPVVEQWMLRTGTFRGMREPMFLHDSCQPLAEVDFSTLLDGVDPMGNECEGMCGV